MTPTNPSDKSLDEVLDQEFEVKEVNFRKHTGSRMFAKLSPDAKSELQAYIEKEKVRARLNELELLSKYLENNHYDSLTTGIIMTNYLKQQSATLTKQVEGEIPPKSNQTKG